MEPVFKFGLGDKLLKWRLVSQSKDGILTKSVYEAYDKILDKVCHLEDFSGSDIALKQHLSFR